VTRKRGTITVEDAIAQANRDPAFVERQRLAENRRAEQLARLRNEQSLLVRELVAAGIGIVDLWDLINQPVEYSGDAVVILMRHLRLPYSDDTRETIARALATKEAKAHWSAIAAEYVKEPDKGNAGPKVGLALALAATTSERTIDQLIRLAMDPANGLSRLPLLKALRKSKNPAAKEAIGKLKQDPQLAPNFDTWLRRR
jgi:hypothetical protein